MDHVSIAVQAGSAVVKATLGGMRMFARVRLDMSFFSFFCAFGFAPLYPATAMSMDVPVHVCTRARASTHVCVRACMCAQAFADARGRARMNMHVPLIALMRERACVRLCAHFCTHVHTRFVLVSVQISIRACIDVSTPNTVPYRYTHVHRFFSF